MTNPLPQYVIDIVMHQLRLSDETVAPGTLLDRVFGRWLVQEQGSDAGHHLYLVAPAPGGWGYQAHLHYTEAAERLSRQLGRRLGRPACHCDCHRSPVGHTGTQPVCEHVLAVWLAELTDTLRPQTMPCNDCGAAVPVHIGYSGPGPVWCAACHAAQLA